MINQLSNSIDSLSKKVETVSFIADCASTRCPTPN